MKKIFLIPAIGLSATYFLKAQGASVLAYSPVEISSVLAKNFTIFEEYCGTYKMQDNPYVEEVNIRLKNGKLISASPEGEEIALEYVENDEFYIALFKAQIIFIRESGLIKGVKVLVKGEQILGEKHLKTGLNITK